MLPSKAGGMGNQNIKQNDIAANKDIKKNSRHFIMGKQSHGEIKDHFYLLFSTTAYVCVCLCVCILPPHANSQMASYSYQYVLH